LNQNSAGNHVNRDNFKLNVYENWHCKHFKNYYQNKFYTADSDEFTAVPLAAMACCETNKSVCLLLIQIKQRFHQRFCLNINLLNPAEHII
jgi:hypothetical protein